MKWHSQNSNQSLTPKPILLGTRLSPYRILYLFIHHFSLNWILFFFFFLGPHPRHMEVPRLGVKSELSPPAYITAIAMPDPSCICDLHHSSRQCLILNPLSEARDQNHNLVVTSWIHFRCATMGTYSLFLNTAFSFNFS